MQRKPSKLKLERIAIHKAKMERKRAERRLVYPGITSYAQKLIDEDAAKEIRRITRYGKDAEHNQSRS